MEIFFLLIGTLHPFEEVAPPGGLESTFDASLLEVEESETRE